MSKELANEIRHFWHNDFKPTPELGCLLECVFKKLKIINSKGNLSVQKGAEFLKSCGAGKPSIFLDNSPVCNVPKRMGSRERHFLPFWVKNK